MANKGGLFTAQFKGEFYWDLYIDLDNTSNKDGSMKREVDQETIVSLSYNDVVKSVNSSTTGMELGLDLGGTVEVLKIEAKATLSTKTTNEYESIADSKTETSKTTKTSDTIEVGGNCHLTLYRLAFRGPGVNYTTDIISTNTSAVIEVPIEVKGRIIPVLKDIEVVYTSESITRPDDVIQVVNGYDPDINDEWNSLCISVGGSPYLKPEYGSVDVSYVWLRPVWTTDMSEGVTGIQVAVQDTPNDSYKDLAKGSRGSFRYLKMVRDPHSKQRITEIALWRRPIWSKEEGPTDKGYSGEYKFHANINEGRQGQKVTINASRDGFHSTEDSDIGFGELFLVWNARELK